MKGQVRTSCRRSVFVLTSRTCSADHSSEQATTIAITSTYCTKTQHPWIRTLGPLRSCGFEVPELMIYWGSRGQEAPSDNPREVRCLLGKPICPPVGTITTPNPSWMSLRVGMSRVRNMRQSPPPEEDTAPAVPVRRDRPLTGFQKGYQD